MSNAEWTILFYIAAHNDLQAFGMRSLGQIWDAGSSGRVNLVALYHGAAGAKRYMIRGPGKGDVEECSEFDSGAPNRLIETAQWAFQSCPAQRYGLVLWSHGTGWAPSNTRGPGMREHSTGWDASELATIMQECNTPSMAEPKPPENLGGWVTSTKWEPDVRPPTAIANPVNSRTSEAVFRSSAAPRPALFRTTLKTILQEATPQQRAICFDDGSQHALDTVQLADVLSTLHQTLKQPLDLLGLDACLMSSLEVAYQLRDHVRHMVASEELVPGTSWPYDTLLAQLKNKPEMSSANLAQLIVEAYIGYYTQKKNRPGMNGGDVTKTAFDLGQIGTVTSTLGELAEAMIGDMAQQRDALWQAQETAQDKETQHGMRWHNKFAYQLWDVASLCKPLAHKNDNLQVRTAANNVLRSLKAGTGGAVLAEAHVGDWFDDTGGVSIYVPPPSVSSISMHYTKMDAAQATNWSNLLRAYHKTS